MSFLRSVFAHVVFAGLFLTSGCATVQEERQQLETKQVCCESVSQFKYEALPAEGSAEFSLNVESPVFAFETGKSYFKAYALPTSAAGRRLQIAHRPGALGMIGPPEYAPAYCPHVIYLDDQFKQVFERTDFPQWKSTLFEGGHFENSLRIPDNAKYVVLLTNPRVYGVRAATRITSGGGYMVGNTVVVNRGGEGISHPCGPVANGVSISLSK
jgi:hypothetical protein